MLEGKQERIKELIKKMTKGERESYRKLLFCVSYSWQRASLSVEQGQGIRCRPCTSNFPYPRIWRHWWRLTPLTPQSRMTESWRSLSWTTWWWAEGGLERCRTGSRFVYPFRLRLAVLARHWWWTSKLSPWLQQLWGKVSIEDWQRCRWWWRWFIAIIQQLSEHSICQIIYNRKLNI